MLNGLPLSIWSKQLVLPPGDKLVVYLDLNHWIGLSQALSGHPKGACHKEVLEVCRLARSKGRAMFVLSAAIYAEVQKIKNPKQRRQLADVIEELTHFDALVSRVVVMELELCELLDPLAKKFVSLPTLALIGFGANHAFGVQTKFSVIGPAGNETELFRQQYGSEAFDKHLEETKLEMERNVLRGPVDEAEEHALRSLGYKPESTAGITESRAAQERELKGILDSETKLRTGRLNDVVSARELVIEFQDILPRCLQARGLVLTDVIQDPESGQRFVRSMPSTEVSIALKTAWHKNGQRQWEVNDIHDIDALALATPYCDVVVTEKACHHILSTAKLAERMQTSLLYRLADLPAVLQTKVSKRLT